jgi:hypothetical protein
MLHMNRQPAIRLVTLWFNSFIPYSVPWDPEFKKVLFRIPSGPMTNKTYVKGPDVTSVGAAIETLSGAPWLPGKFMRVFPELGNNRSFEAKLPKEPDPASFKMHLNAKLRFEMASLGGKTAFAGQLVQKVTASGGYAFKLNGTTWTVEKRRQANSDNIHLGLNSVSRNRPVPELAAGQAIRLPSQSGEATILELDMVCGNPLLEVFHGLPERLGAMRVHGRIWIHPVERWLVHNCEIAAFPAYEGYVRADSKQPISLFLDQVPQGNTPFDLMPVLGKAMRRAQNHGVMFNL